MTKTSKNFSIDVDVYTALRERRVNMSDVVNKALKDFVSMGDLRKLTLPELYALRDRQKELKELKARIEELENE